MKGFKLHRPLFALLALAFSPLLFAQQAMTNADVLKLAKAGFSDELIVSAVNSMPGTFDISTDGLIALKSGGASDKVLAAIVARATTVPDNTAAPSAPPVERSAPPAPAPAASAVPRVFLTSASKGNQWAAARDQSMEMSKDLERDCTGVKITLNQNAADYTISLNHIEAGFMRDNQIQVANHEGDLISKTKEGGSIAGGMKKACKVIMNDWAKTSSGTH